MNERLKKLFNARDLLKEALTWDWSEETKAELQKRLDLIKRDINTECYEKSEEGQRRRREDERDVETNYKAYRDRGC